MAEHFYDAVVVGSGPNGLAAAIRLAQRGLSVLVIEANDTIGGSARSGELTLPGFIHDLCSAVHPLAMASPFFRRLPLEKHGLAWVQPPLPLAHPLGGDQAVVLHRSITETAGGLANDSHAYQELMSPLVRDWGILDEEILQPLLHWPRHPWALARFGWCALRSANGLAKSWFAEEPARALLAGLAAHSFLPLEQVPSAAYGLILGLTGHAVGWPFPRGGTQQLSDALASHLRSLGGEIVTGRRIGKLEELPKARAVLLDLTPRQVVLIAGARLPGGYRSRLQKFQYGPGVFKVDYALDGPIPWQAEACRRAGTVHLGGTLEEIALAEREVSEGRAAERPFVLLTQLSLFDERRAPPGKHIAWAYCHVPQGSPMDMTERIERQIERFAPGFRGQVLARHSTGCREMEMKNMNLVGGPINGGAAGLRHLLARPVAGPCPYRMPVKGLYLCSSSTPPGGGVHGMCGYHAAETAMADLFR